MEEIIRYKMLKSRRKTIGLEITPKGELIVRAPQNAPMGAIEKVIREKASWIREHQKLAVERNKEREEFISGLDPISDEEIEHLANRMFVEFPPRVKEFASRLGVRVGRITIRTQRTRWGSCSSKGNLNFNCLVMLAPKEVQDYIIVHELCHRLEMNHSKRFWELVGSILPDYKKSEKWLNTEGKLIMLRAFEAE